MARIAKKWMPLLGVFVGLLLPADGAGQDQVYALAEVSEQPGLKNGRQAQRTILKSYPRTLQDAGIGGKVQLRFIVDANGKVVGPVASFRLTSFLIFIPELSSKPFVGTASTQEVEIPGGTGLIFPTPDCSGDPMGSTGPTPEAMHAIGFVKDRRDGQFLQLGTPVPEPVVIRSALDLNDPNVPVCEPRN